jgi:hypothetical protein
MRKRTLQELEKLHSYKGDHFLFNLLTFLTNHWL